VPEVLFHIKKDKYHDRQYIEAVLEVRLNRSASKRLQNNLQRLQMRVLEHSILIHAT